MARRTLATTWKNFERLHRQYEKGGRADEKKRQAIDELVQKTNGSRIGDALATLFVHPYALDEYRIEFGGSEDGAFPEWAVTADEETQVMRVSPVGVMDFLAECLTAVETLKTPEARRSFQHYRYQAYMAELSKLPARFLLFVLILREVAHAKHITDVEKKGGEIEVAQGERYLQLLWAFKELEVFFRRTNGIDLRSEFGILWLESDWYVGK